MSPSTRTTVVVVNYNSGELLLDCLGSLQEERVELILVDNGSTDGSPERARAAFPHIRLIGNEDNLGFARGCNLGLAQASTEFILFLNPDTVSKPGAIRAAERFMDEHPRCGALGGMLLNPDGSRQLSLRRFPTYTNILFGRNSLFTKLLPWNPLSRRYLCLDLPYNRPQEVEAICGAWLFARYRALEELSGFDEQFFLYVEDTDLCYRLRRHGWQVWYFPFPVCIHYLGERVGRDRRLAKWHHALGMYKFYKKHYRPGPVTDFILRLGLKIRKSLLSIGI